MDLSRLRRGELLAAIGGIVVFISLFLNWYGFESKVTSPFGGGTISGGGSISAWKALAFFDIVLLVVAVIAVGLAVLTATARTVNLPVAASAITAGAGIVGAVVVIYRIIDKVGPDISVSGPGFEAGVNLKFGIFVALVGAVVVAIGGWLSMQEEGTTFGEAKEQLSESVSGLGGPGSQGPPPGESQPPPSEPPAGPPPGESQPPPGGPPPSDPAAGG